jgi:predicted DNA-binding transcriptional regulator AlpA
MNATSRTTLIAMLTTDLAFSTAERQTVLQLINGETQCGFTSPEAAARLLVTQKSAAELLSVSRVTIWRMKRDGRLNPVEILPGTWRYRYSEIAEIARGAGAQVTH